MSADRSVIRHIVLITVVLGGLSTWVAWRLSRFTRRSAAETDISPVADDGLATTRFEEEAIDIPALPGSDSSTPATGTPLAPMPSSTPVHEQTEDDDLMPPLPAGDDNGDPSPIGERSSAPETPGAALDLHDDLADLAPPLPPARPSPDLAASDPQQPGVPEPRIRIESPLQNRSHVVTAGDTLWSLSVRYLGAGSRWGELYSANQDVLGSPDELPLGVRLRIPERTSR